MSAWRSAAIVRILWLTRADEVQHVWPGLHVQMVRKHRPIRFDILANRLCEQFLVVVDDGFRLWLSVRREADVERDDEIEM